MSRVTINVDGLSLVHTGSGGVSTATLPDVCGTPDAGPVPYPNTAYSRDLVAGTRMVRADGGRMIAVRGSRFCRSYGDEPGVLGGVTSGTVADEASWLTSSMTVHIEGRGACRLTDKMLHNRGNTIDCAGVTQETVSRSRGAIARAAAKRGERRKAKTHRLIVTVVDKKTGAPLKDARVRLRGTGSRSLLTDAAGLATFIKLQEGRHEILVRHGCYPDGVAAVRITRKVHEKKFQLDAPLLRDVAKKRGVEIGVRANIAPYHGPPPFYGEDGYTVSQEFHGVVMGTFWSTNASDGLNPAWPGSPAAIKYDWEISRAKGEIGREDSVVDFASKHGLWVMGTPILWPSGKLTPQWARTIPELQPGAKKADRDKMVRALMRDHTSRCVKAFPGVKSWVAINEPMNGLFHSDVRNHPYWRNYRFANDVCKGRKLYAESLRLAHQLDPDAILIINDFGVEGWDGTTSARGRRARLFHGLVKWLVEQVTKGKNKIPRSKLAVGFQMHYPDGGTLKDLAAGGGTAARSDYRPSSIRKQVKRFKDLGLKIYVTELDISVPGLNAVGNKKGLEGKWEALHEKEVAAAEAAAKAGQPAPPMTAESDYFKANEKKFRAFYRTQRGETERVLRAVLDGSNCPCIVTWDLVDRSTSNFRYYGYFLNRDAGCTPPHDGFKRKPSYFGAMTALQRFEKRFPRPKKKAKGGR